MAEKQPQAGEDGEGRNAASDNESSASRGRASTKQGSDEDVVDVEKAESKSEQQAASANPMHPSQFPDGGQKAWLTVLGGFCCLFVSFGWINCIGVFQEYYTSNILNSYSSSTIAWIVSLETFFMFAGGPVIGRLYDSYGPRYILLVGTFLHVFGLMMTSLSTQYYQFILAQGICSPIGSSALFYPAVSATTTWFYAKRGLAFGIVASGSSLGGVIFPIMIQRIIGPVGFPWTMRIAAFMILGLLIIANLTITTRIPPHPAPLRVSEFVTPFREPPFALLCTSAFFIFLGLFIPFNFVTLAAPVVGGTTVYLASYLISILNAASIFGRIVPGYIADRAAGRFNTTIFMCFLAGLLCLVLWIPARGPAPTILFAALYGFGSGTFVSLAPTLVAQISPDIRKIGTRQGAMFALISPAALVGNPIGGALLQAGIGRGDNPFLYLQIFAGVTIVLGTMFMVLARGVVSNWALVKKV